MDNNGTQLQITDDAPAQAASVIVPAKPARLVSQDDSGIAHLMDTARFEQAQRVAQTLAFSAFLPKHLRGANEKEAMANCFRVVNQAIRWGMDPFSVADETYAVQGKLGYQGKLVAAIVNRRSGLCGRLQATYTGEGQQRKITITGQFCDEAAPRSIELTVAQAATSNDMWKKDPDQKLYYSAVVKWARRHCPEVVLGVLTDDDVDQMARRVPMEATAWGSLTPAQMQTARKEIASGEATADDYVTRYKLDPAGEQAAELHNVN